MRLIKMFPILMCLPLLTCTKKPVTGLSSEAPAAVAPPQDSSHAKFALSPQASGEVRTLWQATAREQAQLDVLAAESLAFKPKDPGKAEVLFKNHCSPCHGLDGRGGGPIADSLAVAPTNFHEWPIKYGKKPAEIALTLTNGRNELTMPAFGAALKKEDLWALSYLVSSWIAARPDKP